MGMSLEMGITKDSLPEFQNSLEYKSRKLVADNRNLAKDLDEISSLLLRIEPAPSPFINSLDLKAQDLSTYYFAAFSDSQNVEQSIRIYKSVKSLVRYILLTDRYYETGN